MNKHQLLEKIKTLSNNQQYVEIIDLLSDEVLKKYKSADLYAEKAQAYYKNDEQELCYNIAALALTIDANNAKALNYFGNKFALSKKYELAIPYYEKAIANSAEFAAPYYNLGNIYGTLKKYDLAIDLYTSAIKLNADSAYYKRGMAHYLKKQYQEALIDLEKYVEVINDVDDYQTKRAISKIEEIKKILNSAKYSEITELISTIKELLMFKDRCVTHYTSLSVARELIINDSKFRLSEGTFLNDTSEGRELFKYLQIFHTAVKPDNASDTIATSFAQKPFIGSFVAEVKHDDLTLWRMYGKENREEAKGCAITIDKESFIKSIQSIINPFDKTNPEEFNFYRVAYRLTDDNKTFIIPGDEGNEDRLNELMKLLRQQIESFTSQKDSDIQNLQELLNTIAYLFKSVEYQHEHELRLVIDGVGLNKYISNDIVAPKVYIELVSVIPVIHKVTLGPKVQRAEEWAAAFYYSLDKEGYYPEILISHLPFK